MLLTCRVVYSYELDSKLVGKVIVLDAGHGGKDKVTSVNRAYESDINLALVLKLKNELSKHGVDVILTRDGDYDLSSPNAFRRKKSDFDNRINLINNSGAHLYLSIHINYLNDTRYYGAQVFYTDGNEMLAKSIQECLDSPLSEKKLGNTIYMYKKLSVPGVLIECGFLSNASDETKLRNPEYQKKLCSVIATATCQYLSNT